MSDADPDGSFYALKANALDGTTVRATRDIDSESPNDLYSCLSVQIEFSAFRGKVVLIENTATL